MADLKITDEAEAFAFLKDALKNKYENKDVTVVFDKWPILELKYEGEGFQSTLSPQIMEGLLELQRSVNRVYANAVDQQPNANYLRDVDRKQIELRPKVSEGSSKIEVDYTKVLEHIGTELIGKMSGHEIVFTLIGIAIAFGAVVVAKSLIERSGKTKEAEIASEERIQMSADETERLKIFSEATKRDPVIQHTVDNVAQAQADLIKAGRDGNRMEYAGIPLSQATARILTMRSRTEAEESQQNGNYLILGVNFERENEVRLKLSSVEDGKEFNASFTDNSLDGDSIKLLQDAEWGRQPVYLSVNARSIRGAITSAVVVSVRAQPRRPALRPAKPAITSG